MIQIAFYKGKTSLLDKIIQWGSGGPYSHVEIVFENGLAIGSSARDGGVRAKLIDFDDGHWDFVDVPWADAEEVREFMEGEIGRKYDYGTVLFTHVLSMPWRSPRRWFCSEIAASALRLGYPYRYSPSSLARVLIDINRIVDHG